MVRRIYNTQRQHGSHLKVHVRPYIHHLLAAGCGAALLLTACSFGPIRLQPHVNGATITMAFTQKPHSTTNAAPATRAPSLLEKEMKVIALEISAVKMLKEQGSDMNFNVR